MSQMRSKTAICDKFVAAKLNIMGKIEHLYDCKIEHNGKNRTLIWLQN